MPTDQERTQATRQAIYEFFLEQNNPELVRLMEEQGVRVPDDDSNLRLRQDLFNLTHLGDKVKSDGASALKHAVGWLDGLLSEAGLEADSPMINLRLEIRTQCVLAHLMPPNVLGKAAARNGKKALEKQFPKRDAAGSKGSSAAGREAPQASAVSSPCAWDGPPGRSSTGGCRSTRQ